MCVYVCGCLSECVHIEPNICLLPSLSVVYICSVSLNETVCMHVGAVCVSVCSPPMFYFLCAADVGCLFTQSSLLLCLSFSLCPHCFASLIAPHFLYMNMLIFGCQTSF